MNNPSEIPSSQNLSNTVVGIIVRFLQVVIVFAIQAVILFLSAGRINWIWAWVYIGICLVSMAINGTFLLKTSPETIAERGRPQWTKKWDKLIGTLWALAQYLVLPLVAGLDARFAWTRGLSSVWNIIGAVVLAAGLGFSGWAMIVNAYFSTTVRIQEERGHTVCRTGPYRFIRHPGYVGFILQSVGTALIFGSIWALIPGIAAAVLIIVRTALEDRTLQSELPGYPDYVREVRFRLIPGIW